MGKKIGILMMVFLLLACMVSFGFAADKSSGKITAISSDKVTVTLEGGVPGWLKAGSTVTAGNGAPKVLSVKGNEVVLRFSKAKAKRLAVGSPLSLEESAGDELQGC